ncbi:MAG TPA: hypothetical protein VNN80_30200, partial [Polyangiaceae bacterium]|nr:hypothetical protein [Polyangiaceae bacterium]
MTFADLELVPFLVSDFEKLLLRESFSAPFFEAGADGSSSSAWSAAFAVVEAAAAAEATTAAPIASSVPREGAA